MPEIVLSEKRIVGIKQLRRALAEDQVLQAFFAADADPALIAPLEALCREKGVEFTHVSTMQALGKACGISVGAAAAANLR